MTRYIFTWLSAALLVCTSASTAIELSKAESAYIAAQDSIVLAGGLSFEPFLIQEQDGSVSGYDADIAQLISEHTGLNIRFSLGPWQQMTQRAEQGEFAGLSSSSTHAGRESYFTFSDPYIQLTRIVFVPKNNPKSIHGVPDLVGKKVALQRGNLIFDAIVEDSQPLYFDSLEQVIDAVASGAADYTVYDESISYLALKLGLLGMIEPSFSVGEPFDVVFALAKDQPQLISIINKGLQAISEEERLAMRRKWFSQLTSDVNVTLSDEELIYLSEHAPLTYCLDSDVNLFPIEYLAPDGQHQGMSRDLLDLLEQRIGIQFLHNPVQLALSSSPSLEEQGCDIFPRAIETELPVGGFISSDRVMEGRITLISMRGQPYIDNISTELDKTFSIRRDFIRASQIRQHFPTIKLVMVDTIQQGLELVSTAKVDAHIDLLIPGLYQVNHLVEDNLQIAGLLPWKLHWTIAIDSQQPQLRSIINKALATISRQERLTIKRQWMATELQTVTNYRLVTLIILISVVIIAIIASLYFKVKKINRKVISLLSSLKTTQQALELRNSQLEQLNVTDHLTQIANRKKLDLELAREISRFQRYKSPLALIMVDIDFFKQVNDTFGHQVGDEVLIDLAACLQTNTRPSDLLGRWAGEEFLIICPETDISALEGLAERLRRKVSTHAFSTGKPLTISLGLTFCHSDDSAHSFIKRADQALYEAKAAGRNTYRLVG